MINWIGDKTEPLKGIKLLFNHKLICFYCRLRLEVGCGSANIRHLDLKAIYFKTIEWQRNSSAFDGHSGSVRRLLLPKRLVYYRWNQFIDVFVSYIQYLHFTSRRCSYNSGVIPSVRPNGCQS